MVLLHDRIAECRFDAPEPENDGAFDAEILLDAREERRVSLGALLTGLDAPVGDAAVDVLPELLIEFWLIADFAEHGCVGLEPAHHAGVGRIRYALGERAGP